MKLWLNGKPDCEVAAKFSGKPEFGDDYFRSDHPHGATRLMREQIKKILEVHPRGPRGVAYPLIKKTDTPKTTRSSARSKSRFERCGSETRFHSTGNRESTRLVIDESREIDTPVFWDGPSEFLESVAPQYRANPWADQP
jgi:hypothetical protein